MALVRVQRWREATFDPTRKGLSEKGLVLDHGLKTYALQSLGFLMNHLGGTVARRLDRPQTGASGDVEQATASHLSPTYPKKMVVSNLHGRSCVPCSLPDLKKWRSLIKQRSTLSLESHVNVRMRTAKSITITGNKPADCKGELKSIGGSTSDAFNNVLASAVMGTLRINNSDADTQTQQFTAAVAALTGIAPQDELEGMLAGQLIAVHAAAMECYRRAMLQDQTLEGHNQVLSQANKLSRTYAVLVEALDRHRGKGTQQTLRVEHVHVHAGGQAVVGAVQKGGGSAHETGKQPHAKSVAHAPEPPMWSEDQAREPMSLSRDAERPLPHARRRLARSAKG